MHPCTRSLGLNRARIISCSRFSARDGRAALGADAGGVAGQVIIARTADASTCQLKPDMTAAFVRSGQAAEESGTREEKEIPEPGKSKKDPMSTDTSADEHFCISDDVHQAQGEDQQRAASGEIGGINQQSAGDQHADDARKIEIARSETAGDVALGGEDFEGIAPGDQADRCNDHLVEPRWVHICNRLIDEPA